MRRAKTGLTFYVDMDSAAQTIGAALAMTEMVEKDNAYIDAILKNAWQETEKIFNAEAATFAAAGGGIRHMYEWGTAGINRGRTNMRPQPEEERARLWKTALIGSGWRQTLSYTFKPSMAFVPKPTKRDTGMSTEVIEMLNPEHIFEWKAAVLETGAMVTIMPQEAEFLLIPNYGGETTGWKPSEIARGYKLTKGPVRFAPGRNVHGNFTAYWSKFWEGRGAKKMNASILRQIEQDFLPMMAATHGGNLSLPLPGAFTAKVEKEKSDAKQQARTKARARKAT